MADQDMDGILAEVVSRRHRRSVTLIILAVIVLIAASGAYMYSFLSSVPKTASLCCKSPAFGTVVTYEFVTPLLRCNCKADT